jgi:hypothetical protein
MRLVATRTRARGELLATFCADLDGRPLVSNSFERRDVVARNKVKFGVIEDLGDAGESLSR